MEDLVIGIDLGTTNSACAVYLNTVRDRKLRILENKENDRITPSVVCYTEKNTVVVGVYAKKMALMKPENSIFEIKRLIGRHLKEPQVQESMRHFLHQVNCCGHNTYITIKHLNGSIKKTPTEITKQILKKIKNDAEEKLGASVNKAVITVPAYFNVDQREATLKAANNAGFTVLKLLNEPTAALLSYHYQFADIEESYSLVYDLGGGTFDVAVLKRTEDDIDIISVDGDSNLGGKDFDNLIIDFVCNKLRNDYNFDPSGDTRKMRRLHNDCEEAKRHVSFQEKVTIFLKDFVPNHDKILITLTRSAFEKMIDTLLKNTITIVDNCLKSSELSKGDIREVILSGGSTKIPKVQKMLSDYFEGKTLNKFLNPDECVAEGAALQAALLSTNSKQTMNFINITDVVPFSLGVSDECDLMLFVIRKNSKLPITNQTNHVTVEDQQKNALFTIYEGERLIATKNRLIGEFTIENLTPAPPGQCEIILTMSVDNNGILTVSAKERFKNNSKMLKVSYTRGHRNTNEVLKEIKSAEEMINEDLKFKNFAMQKGYLLNYCRSVSYNIREKK